MNVHLMEQSESIAGQTSGPALNLSQDASATLSVSTPTPPAPSHAAEPVQRHSCILCQARKVKCDREVPCTTCKRAGKSCSYKVPSLLQKPPQRVRNLGLHARVKVYERLLAKFNVNLDALSTSDDGEPTTPAEAVETDAIIPNLNRALSQPLENLVDDSVVGQAQDNSSSNREGLVLTGAEPKYFGNSMWKEVHREVHKSDILPWSTSPALLSNNHTYGTRVSNQIGVEESGFILGVTLEHLNLQAFHPLEDVALQLWKIYLENVDPLCKLLHPSSTEALLLAQLAIIAAGGVVSDGLFSLFYAIYLSAVMSMSESEVQIVTGQAKSILQSNFRRACQYSLVRAGFLQTEELMVLQAYTLFLQAIFQDCDSCSMSTLTATAVRIAQRIGLHHDWAQTKLRPFDVEMRRRLWWQLMVLDRMAGELCSSGPSIDILSGTACYPLNVNDGDIRPDMISYPKQREGSTDMMFCLMRYEILSQGSRKGNRSQVKPTGSSWWDLLSQPSSLFEKQSATTDLKEYMENNYICYCDPLNKIQFLVSVLARLSVSAVSLKLYQPGLQVVSTPTSSHQMKGMFFTEALRLMEYGQLLRTTASVQGFMWYFKKIFQWHTLIFLLAYIQTNPQGSDADRAWCQLEHIYVYFPDFILDQRNPVCKTIRRLATQSYHLRESQSGDNIAQTRTSALIQELTGYESTREAAPYEAISAQWPFMDFLF